jgi:hypothetical protein
VVGDVNGYPLNLSLSKANRNDLPKVLETIDGIRIGQRKRKHLRLEQIGLTLAEATETLHGIQQTVVHH